MKQLALLTMVLFLGINAHAIDPTEVYISVYAVGLSTNADCSNPTIVVDNGTTAVEHNFLSLPRLGSASVPAGTYTCMIIKMSDIIKFRPASTSGSCTGGTQYTIDVCRAGNGNYTPLTISGTAGTYGSTTACTGTTGSPTNDQVTLFLSTQSTNTGGSGEAFVRPASAGTNGFTLNGVFTVSGSASGTFVVNFNNKIDGSGGSCDLQPPIFGFR